MGDMSAPGPVMDQDEADRALARLGAEHEAVETSLFALQDHAGRRLLEGAELTGATADRWARTDAAITLLWSYFDAYTAALESARALRSAKRRPGREELTALTALLRGESVTVPGGAEAALAAELVGGPAGSGDPARSAPLSESFTLERLVSRMNTLYAACLDVVVASDVVWSALPARIDLLAAELQRTLSLANSVGVRPGEHPAGDDLQHISRTLTALRRQVISDPLAFWQQATGATAPGSGRPDTERYDREARALEDVRREIDAVLGVRQDAESRLAHLRDVLSRADRTLAEARAARTEVLAKIAAFEVPAVSGPPTALHEELSVAVEYRRQARWNRLSPLLDALETKAEDELLRARESLGEVTTPLAVRAELRGRLDAYRAKVAHHGLAEEPLLTERYDAARRMLWSAPCDLRAAEAAVQRFVQAAAENIAQITSTAQAGRDAQLADAAPNLAPGAPEPGSTEPRSER